MLSQVEEHLGVACVRGLKARQHASIITDTYLDDKTLTGGMLLAVGWELADWIKAHIPDRRIGIVLPPGIGATVVNLACVLSDRVPVNLNFTAGSSANRHFIDIAGIQTVFTAETLIKRLKEFPWPSRRLEVGEILRQLSKTAILWKRARVALLSESSIIRTLALPSQGGDSEAGLLCTSGSSGNPKGVVLTHRNIVGNVRQIQKVLRHKGIDSLLGCLPVFHSFGFTATLWWPLISGPMIVSHVSPVDIGRIVEVIKKCQVSLMITTPTFLRKYTRKASKEQMASLRFVITGAEKLPMTTLREFEEKFDVPVCEGYGMTETSPVISTNYPDPDDTSPQTGGDGPFRRVGSVGKLLEGVEVKTTCPHSGAVRDTQDGGLLWFKGPNIFPGYLDDPHLSKEVLKDDWYHSGDIGRLDEDGFLYIDGRHSRFSKIGGEMVSHERIEHALKDIAAPDEEEEADLVVMGVNDKEKGEAVVVLGTRPFDREEVRREFLSLGIPNLWLPKHFFLVEEIPRLASGKLDLKECQSLAEQLA